MINSNIPLTHFVGENMVFSQHHLTKDNQSLWFSFQNLLRLRAVDINRVTTFGRVIRQIDRSTNYDDLFVLLFPLYDPSPAPPISLTTTRKPRGTRLVSVVVVR